MSMSMVHSLALVELENLVPQNLNAAQNVERIVKLDEKDAQAFRDWYNNNKTHSGIEEVYTIVGVAGLMGDRKS